MPTTDETPGQASDPLAVPCPSCDAATGEPCRRLAGHPGTFTGGNGPLAYHFVRLPFTVAACTSCNEVFRSQALAHNGQCDQCRGHALALATDL